MCYTLLGNNITVTSTVIIRYFSNTLLVQSNDSLDIKKCSVLYYFVTALSKVVIFHNSSLVLKLSKKVME